MKPLEPSIVASVHTAQPDCRPTVATALAVAAVLCASLAPSAHAVPPPRHPVLVGGLRDRPSPGVLARLRLASEPRQLYYVYRPRTALAGAPLVIAVHGISRNARRHAERLAPLAERYGAVLVAPLFDKRRFPDYQRLGREGRGERADQMLERIIAEVETRTGAGGRRVYLFGFSGGGQFVHRFAMAYPDRVASYVVGAAGWYTFPDETIAFPRGTRIRRCLHDVCFDPDQYLQVPALVLVGERDVNEGRALRHTAAVSRQQGRSRVDRGAHWIEAMRTAARERGFNTEFEFDTLARSGHSFERADRRGGMGERVFSWFFATGRDTDGRPRDHPRHHGAPHLAGRRSGAMMESL